jgi:AbrB family looped-hinge helix DNA binding protein
MIATIRRNGQLTIPAAVRRAAALDEGDEVEVEVTEQGILLRRVKSADPDPWYYGTPEWEAGLTRALEDAAAGRVTSQDSTEEFFAELDRRPQRADA